jgi:hypothetical protein
MDNHIDIGTASHPEASRESGLLARQWSQYAGGHRDRLNLLVHALTVPVFDAGTVALVGGVWSWPLAPLGAALMLLAIAAQGRAHRREAEPPASFRGPLDALARLLAEQWVTFPRYVLSGRFVAVWRAPRTSSPS